MIKLNIKKFYCVKHIKHTGLILSIPLKRLNLLDPLPILWCVDGIYGLISTAIVADAIQVITDAGMSDCEFIWNQTIEVPQEIGDQLTNKQFDYNTEQSEN